MSGDRYKIADQQGLYFVTFTVVNWIDVFTRKDYKFIITDSLNYCIANKGLEVYAWVLMSNHLHLIIKAKEGYMLSHIIRDFKKFTSKQIVQKIQEIGESRKEWLLDKFNFEARKTRRAENYKFWKDDNHAIQLDNTEWILQRLEYIHQNPVKQYIVELPHEYLFSSAIDYADGKGLVNISKL
ncbi:MAG: transposase [Flavobacteriales bacterium]|nr:transposase [Flavobacteriales bacterium]